MIEQPIVIFLHLPKTAGITFGEILRQQYGDKFWHPHHITVASLNTLTEEQKQATLACHGQMFYGIHEVFLNRPYKYIAFLRHPVDRMVSWYYYIKRRPRNWFHETVTSKNMSLEDFVHFIGDLSYDNQQTRWIAGNKPVGQQRTLEEIAVPSLSDFPLAPLQDGWLEAAKQHIESDFVIGLTERFDESLLLMKREFGWKEVFYHRKNVTKDRPMRDKNVPEALVELIKTQEHLDVALYDFAKAHFDAQVAQAGEDLQRQMAAFDRNNRMYNFARRIYHSVPVQVRPLAKGSFGRMLFGRSVE